MLASSFDSPNDDKHLGKWEGVDKNKIGYISFDSEGYAAFEIDGQIVGGEKFEMQGMQFQMKYKIDYSITPVSLDIIMYSYHEKQELNRMKGILEFCEDGSMKMALDFSGVTRPVNFDENSLILTKVKD